MVEERSGPRKSADLSLLVIAAVVSLCLVQLPDQLLRHRLLPSQHPTEIRAADAKQLGELVPSTNLLLEPPQIFKRLVHRGGDGIGFLAQSLGSAEQLHQGSVGYPLALSQAGERMMRNLRLIEQFAVTDPVSLLNVEHRSGDGSPISQLDAIVGRICIFADEFVFLDVVGFLANRLLSQREDMPALERSALVVLPALEFGLRVEMIADKTTRM